MNKWDKKAEDYSRYTDDENSFEANVLKTIKDLHVDFKNKKVLDIGCGTGVYTLRIAKDALYVDGLDSSQEMLKLLNEDAKTLNITNITTYLSTWDAYKLPKEIYDIAICTMSPALKNSEDFQKMNDSSKIRIYLGWAGKRESQILQELFEAHGEIYSSPNGSKSLKDWLTVNNHFYQVIPFDENKVRTREFSKAIKNFKWHLEIRGIKPDEKLIKNILKKFSNENGEVKETTINHMNLIIW